MQQAPDPPGRQWTFTTNYAHVLWCLFHWPDARLRDLAAVIGITERAAQRIVGELVVDGYVSRTRSGTRNHYRVNVDRPMRNELYADVPIQRLLDVLPPPQI